MHNNISNTDLNKLLNNKICLENHNKPIKAISNFKVSDLKDLAIKLNLNLNMDKIKKQDLYNSICLQLIWD